MGVTQNGGDNHRPTIATASKEEILAALELAERHRHKEKHCKWCHSVFFPTRAWQEFCKPACRNLWHNSAWEIEAMQQRQRVQQLEEDCRELELENRALRKRIAELEGKTE